MVGAQLKMERCDDCQSRTPSNEIELNGDELNLVVGGWGSYYWAPPAPASQPWRIRTSPAAAMKESVGDPAHSFGAATASAYRGSALTHDRPRILTCRDGEPPVPTGVRRVRMLAKGVDRVGK